EGLEGQVEALGVGQTAGFQALDDTGVVAGVDHDGHILVVLRSRTDHGRAADIDVLDGVGQVAVRLGHGGFEGVEVDRYQVDRLDAVLVHDRTVQCATAEDAAVDLRVQGLDAAVHHFRETGVVGDFDRGHAVVLEQLVGAAGGEDLDTECSQFASEVEDAGLVGNADQGAADGEAGGLVGHGRVHWNRYISEKGRHRAALSGGFAYSRSYCLSFLRSVPRLRPSSSEALVWLPFTWFMTVSSSGASTSVSTRLYTSVTSAPSRWAK